MPKTITNEDGSQYLLSDEDIADIKTVRMSATHHASWPWNESALTYLPPSNPPDGRAYIWNAATTAWVAFS